MQINYSIFDVIKNRKFSSVLLAFCFVFWVIGYIFFYLFFTPQGGRHLLHSFILRSFPDAIVSEEKVEGSISSQLVIKDCLIRNISGWPPDTFIRIQKLDIYFTRLRRNGLNLEFHNVRIAAPGSDPIVLDGIIQEGRIDAEVFAPYFDISEIKYFFPGVLFLNNLSGSISDVNLTFNGSIKNINVKGSFYLERFIKETFSLVEVPVEFDLSLENLFKKPYLSGVTTASKGKFILPRSLVNIESGKLTFKGNLAEPVFDVKGSASIEGVSISAHLRGTPKKPELKLTSSPSESQDKLLLMLVTGKSWKNTQSGIESGQLSAYMLREFVDYFILGGSSGSFFKQFGIDDVVLKLDAQTIGVGIKKDISQNIEVSYAVEQAKATELNQTQAQSINDSVYLKYKNRF